MSLYNSPIYRRLPPTLQSIVITGRGFVRNLLRQNQLTWQVLNTLMRNQWLSWEELRLLQLQQLRKVIKIAEENVPYYKRLFKKIGFHWKDLDSLEVFSQLPILTKGIVRENLSEFIPPNPRRLWAVSGRTSGTTGTPLIIYSDLLSIVKEQAFVFRQKKWAACQKGERKVWIRGDLIASPEQKAPPYWRYNLADNQLLMSSYHISERTLPSYIRKIREFAPSLIEAYPSSIFAIASFMKNHGYSPIPIKSIITSSETLLNGQKKVIEEMFRCRVFDWYGSYERVAAIGTCEHGNYHIIEDYGYTELIDYRGSVKEIVSTGFNNRLMPLIRYKTGDLVIPDNSNTPCPCKRHFRVVESIVGRLDDYVLLPDGRKIGRLDFIFKDDLPILEGQICQYEDYSIRIRVVPDQGFNSSHKEKLIENARLRIGQTVDISVDLVSEIPRSRNGKLKMVVSNLSNG